MAVVPMFPLGTVLLPGGVLPLQVFEPRYRQMVRAVLADDTNPPEFGVVLIERGWEVGGGDARSSVGTLARIADIRALTEGRYALVAVGHARIRVNAWLPDDPYPIADIDVWDDEPSRHDEATHRSRVEALHARVRRLNDDVRALGEMAPPPDTEISDDPAMAIHHLGSLAPLGAADRYRLLAAPSIDDRLDALEAAIDDAEALVRFRST
jgi:Lon protease-like protein